MAEPSFIPSSPILSQVRDSYPQLKDFTDPQVAEVIWQSDVVSRGREDKYDKDLFFQELGTYRNDIDFLDSLGRGFSRGWYAVSDALDLGDQQIRQATGGFLDPIMPTDEEYAKRRVARDIGRKKNSYSYEDLNRLMAITDKDSDIGDWSSQIWDISLIGGLLAESLTQFAPALAATAGSALVTAGTGGLAAPVVAPMLATFLIQSGIVGSSAFHEYLKEEEGVRTEEDYLRAFSDPDVMNRAVEHGAKYGLPVAALDAFSIGIAGRIPQLVGGVRRTVRGAQKPLTSTETLARSGKSVSDALSAKRRASKFAKRWTPEVMVQGGLGSGGEIMGSLWSKGEINGGEAFLEGIMEPFMLPLEIMARSPGEARVQMVRRGIKKAEKKQEELATRKSTEKGLSSIETEGPIEREAEATKTRNTNKKEGQQTVESLNNLNNNKGDFIPSEHNINILDDLIAFTDLEVGDINLGYEELRKAGKLNVYVTNIGEGLAGIFATKGYLEETDQPGVYVVTQRGFEEASRQPTEESPETRAPTVKQEDVRISPEGVIKYGEEEGLPRLRYDTQTVADTAETPPPTEQLTKKVRGVSRKSASQKEARAKEESKVDDEVSTLSEARKILTDKEYQEVKLNAEERYPDRGTKHDDWVTTEILRQATLKRRARAKGKPTQEVPATRSKEELNYYSKMIGDHSFSEGEYQALAGSYVREFINNLRGDKQENVEEAQELIQKALEAASEKLEGPAIARNQEKILRHMGNAITHTKAGHKRKRLTKPQKTLLRVIRGLQNTLDTQGKSGAQVEGNVTLRQKPKETYTGFVIDSTPRQGETLGSHYRTKAENYRKVGLSWQERAVKAGPDSKEMATFQKFIDTAVEYSRLAEEIETKQPDTGTVNLAEMETAEDVVAPELEETVEETVDEEVDTSEMPALPPDSAFDKDEYEETSRIVGQTMTTVGESGRARPNIETTPGAVKPEVNPDLYEFLNLNADKLTVKQAEEILKKTNSLEFAREVERREGFKKNDVVKNLAKEQLITQQQLAKEQATDANMTAQQVTEENYEAGDNTLRTLSEEEQLGLLEWIQERVGQNIAVAFETVKHMTDTVRVLKHLPSNIEVQGYANPIDKVIVLALDRAYSQEIAGEEAFHIAARLLLTPDEWEVLNGYDWIGIARENDIDVSQYPDDLQAWEALAKVAAKFLTGEKVVNIGPNNQRWFQRLKNFLNQLANYVRGKGWKKLYPSPQDIFISFDVGELADRPHNPYPLGPQSEQFDLNATKQLDEKIEDVKKNLEPLPGSKQRGWGLNQLATGWAYLQEALNHIGYYAAKNYLVRPIVKAMEEMRQFQDSLILEGLESYRVYSEATPETQAEVDKFISLLDFVTTRNQWLPSVVENDDGSITISMPNAEEAQGADMQEKLNLMFPEGINGREVKLSRNPLRDKKDKITKRFPPNTYTINNDADRKGISPAQAFNSYRQGAEYQKELLRQAITYLIAEMPRNSSLEDLQAEVTNLTYKIAESYQDVNKKTGKPVASPETKKLQQRRKLVVEAIKYIKSLNDQPFWMPRIRKGDRAIFVKDAEGTIQHLEVYDQKRFESKKAFESMLDERVAKVKQNFQEHEIKKGDFNLSQIISDELATPGSKDFTVVSGLGLIETLLTVMSHPDSDTSKIDDVINLIRRETEGRKLKGIDENRQKQNITGHWRPEIPGYVSSVTKSNLNAMSYQLGKVIYKPLIDSEHQRMLDQALIAEDVDKDYRKAAAMRRTYRYTKKYLKFVNDPKVQGAIIRNIVFHTALGGRFSSAVLNLMQIPQALLPFLYAVNPDRFLIDSPFAIAKNTAITGKAFYDAMRLVKKVGLGNIQTAYNMELEGARPSYLTEDEWQLMRTLFSRGVVSPIHLEDLTDKLSYQALARKSWKVPGKVPLVGGRESLELLDATANLSSWMFGSTEFINRATTALATYRMAKNNKAMLNRIDQMRNQSHFADSDRVASMTFEDNAEGWTNAAHIAVAETQFMMGKFNRPQLFYAGGALGPIFSQFMSFPFQYLETMIKNIRRMATPGERALGTRMLSLMLVAMIGMAGVFGIPFMENLRRFIQQVANTDLEKDLREVLIDALGPTWTNIIVSGSIFEYLGVEAKQRVGVGTMVDSDIFRGDVGFIFGPLGGILETAWTNVGDGIHEGNLSKIARGIVPLGFVRDVLGTSIAFDEGYTTRAGTQLIAPQDILPTDYFITFLGFNPANRALERDKQAYARMARTSGQKARDVVLKRVTRLWRKAREADSPQDRREYRAEMREEIRAFNERARDKKWRPITSNILNNRRLQNINTSAALMKRAPKIKKRELLESFRMLDRLKNY